MIDSLLRHRGFGFLAVAALTAATLTSACSEGSAAGVAVTESATPDVASGDPLMTIEQYAMALSDDRADDAYELLGAPLTDEAGPEDLELLAEGIESMTLTSSEVLADGADRTVYQVEIEVRLAEGAATGWSTGTNTRWVELTHRDGRWLITRLASAPLFP